MKKPKDFNPSNFLQKTFQSEMDEHNYKIEGTLWKRQYNAHFPAVSKNGWVKLQNCIPNNKQMNKLFPFTPP
jgi:hypothetical protein